MSDNVRIVEDLYEEAHELTQKVDNPVAIAIMDFDGTPALYAAAFTGFDFNELDMDDPRTRGLIAVVCTVRAHDVGRPAMQEAIDGLS